MFTRDPVVLEEIRAKQEAKAALCRQSLDPRISAEARKHEKVAMMVGEVLRELGHAEGYSPPARDPRQTNILERL